MVWLERMESNTIVVTFILMSKPGDHFDEAGAGETLRKPGQ